MTATIVVPLDTSPVAECALPVARSLARTLRASITLVSVIELPFELSIWLAGRDDRKLGELETVVRERQHYLDHHAERLGDAGTTTVVRIGDASTEVLSFAASFAEPIIVMTSHGVTGFRQQVAGTVTTRIIHGARCPVVVVRAHAETGSSETASTFTRLLVALDGSEFAEQALNRALELFGAFKPALHLVRVAELSHWFSLGYDGVGYYDGLTGYIKAVREEASEYLRIRAEALAKDGYEVTWEVCEGYPDREIIDAAREHRCDLLVLGTHGRSGLSRVVIGSVAERVLHNTPAPLMLVHPTGETARSSAGEVRTGHAAV